MFEIVSAKLGEEYYSMNLPQAKKKEKLITLLKSSPLTTNIDFEFSEMRGNDQTIDAYFGKFFISISYIIGLILICPETGTFWYANFNEIIKQGVSYDYKLPLTFECWRYVSGIPGARDTLKIEIIRDEEMDEQGVSVHIQNYSFGEHAYYGIAIGAYFVEGY